MICLKTKKPCPPELGRRSEHVPIYKERKTRKLQPIVENDKIQHMIKTYLLGQVLFTKDTFPPIPVKVVEVAAGENITVETDAPLVEQVVLYKVFNKYMEVSCTVEKSAGPERFLLHVRAFSIALEPRAHPRVHVVDSNVIISNIRAARNTINASLFNIPTSVKVHFSQYEQKLKHLADEVGIKVFDTISEKLDLVKKSHKSFWLQDTQDIASYIPDDPEAFVDYREHLNTDMDKVMNDYRKEKIVSEVIVPVIYIGHDGVPIPLGYIHLVSRSKQITIDTVMELKILAFEMVDRIRESNTMLINKKQEITNMSKGGLQLKITDDELKTFLIHQRGMSFDIVFKLQQPITVFTEIIYTAMLPSRDLLIGVKIMGRSSRKGEMERFHELIDQALAKINA